MSAYRYLSTRGAILVGLAGTLLAAQTIPARIVSTSPSITETMFALGLGDRVVGVSTYCWFPPAVATLPKVGTFLKPDAELIARLRPDLVFVHRGPHPAASQLATLKIRAGGHRTRLAGQRLLDDPADRRGGRRAGSRERLIADHQRPARSREGVGRRQAADGRC